MSITIFDKLPQIVQSSVVLLDRALKELNPVPKALDNQLFRSYCEEVCVGLILCFGGENKPLARDLAEQILLQMTNLKYIGSMFVANVMYKPSGLPKSKSTDPRHLIGRLSLLASIAREGIPDKDYQPVPTVDLAARNLESPSYEVRNAANELIFEVYKKIGSRKIEPMLMGVRENLLVPLFRKFSEFDMVGGEADGGAGGVLERFGDARVRSAKSKGGGQPAELAGVKSCMYCLRTDRNFLEMKKYHMHLSRECPMLTVCRSCAHVVEISQMQEHLSSACEVTARAYDYCKDCDEYYTKGEYDEHLKKGTHITKEEISKGNSQDPERRYFCPLCHKDLGQVGNGGLGWVWRKHLIMDGCSKNDRTF